MFDGGIMRTNKNNKSYKQGQQIKRQRRLMLPILALLGISHFCYSQDMVSGTELKDSSLSLSLSARVNLMNDGSSSQLVISQHGIYNTLEVNQQADFSNQINVLQNGISNFADLNQQGFGNIINLEQLGSDNFAEVVQDGNANIANIIQTGEQTFTVHQIGSDMVVNITQY